MKIEKCDFPDDLLYDIERNLWVRMEGRSPRVGANTILVWVLGVPSSVRLKPVGTRVSLGQSIGSIEGSRHFDVVRAPFSGVIETTNDALLKEPRILTKDSYGAGWIAKITPSNPAELDSLAKLPAMADELGRRVRELRVHCFAAFPDYEMFEVGVECSAVLSKLNEFLGNSDLGTVVHVVSDDNSADIEMIRWSDQTGQSVIESRKEGNLYHFIVKKTH